MMPGAEDFRAFIASRLGCEPPAVIEPGRFVRFSTNGKRGDDAGYCKLFPDLEGGIVGNFRSGEEWTWQAKREKPRTEAEQRAWRERIERERREAQTLRERAEKEAAERASALWGKASPAPANHAYLLAKKVRPYGLKLYRGPLAVNGMKCDGALVIPIRNATGELQSLEFISTAGEKRFLPGGRTAGGYFAIGKPDGVLCIAEGYATAASIHEATGYAVAVAFTAGNLSAIAAALRAKLPNALLIICADDDYRTSGNPGMRAATEAARQVGGLLAVPVFGPNRPEGATDMNDLAVHRGIEAVRDAVASARQPGHATPPPAAAHVGKPDTKTATPEPRSEDSSPGNTSGAQLLDEVCGFLGRFISYPSEHAQLAHALWIVHSHLMDAWESTPRIAFLSPEPGSGKTRALEITETLVPRPVDSVNATSAYLFRKISDEEGPPTLLYDEIDTVFGPKAKDNEEIRGVLNAGHRRGATAGRCVLHGKTIATEELPAYCAVAMAGLGALPDTILTRSVVIRMRRRAPNEAIEPYRRRIHAPQGNAIRDRLAQWANSIVGRVGSAFPDMPTGIADRDADVWEALLAVADEAGADWPGKARAAAVALVADGRQSTPSYGVRLLADLRAVFGDRAAMPTEDIIKALVAIDEAPWADIRGKPLDARRLANYLHQYGIRSRNIRAESGVVKGYVREDLHDSWTRYLGQPPSPDKSATSATSATSGDAEVIG